MGQLLSAEQILGRKQPPGMFTSEEILEKRPPARPLKPSPSQPTMEPSSPDRGVVAAIKRIGGGLVAMPGQMLETVVKPPQNLAEVSLAFTPGALIAKRMLVDPAIQTFQTGIQAAREGDIPKAALSIAASPIPFVGPQIPGLYERSASGDLPGAITEGLFNIATVLPGLPKIRALGKKILPRKAPTTRTEVPPIPPAQPEPLPVKPQAQVPRTGRTYDAIQKEIDAVETNLDQRGIDPVKLYFSESDYGPLGPPAGYKKMPPELERLYKERDLAGAFEFDQNIRQLRDHLKTAGVSDPKTLFRVFRIPEKAPTGVEQYRATESFRDLADLDPAQMRQLAEDYAIARAIEKSKTGGREIDALEDIPQAVRQEAAKDVSALFGFFHRGKIALELPQPRGVAVAPQEAVAPSVAISKALGESEKLRFQRMVQGVVKKLLGVYKDREMPEPVKAQQIYKDMLEAGFGTGEALQAIVEADARMGAIVRSHIGGWKNITPAGGAAPAIVPRGTLELPARPAIPAPEGTVLPIGIPGIPPFRTTPVKPLSPLRKFVNPEIEERFQAAKVSPQETWWDRAKQSLETFKTRATRTYEHLERGEKYGPLIFNLKQNEVAGSIAIDRTLRDLTGITKGMDRNQLDLFSKRVVLDDLAENYARLTAKGEQWDELAFGITPKELNAEAARFHGLSEADPTVAEALKKRRGMADSVKTEYIAAMDKVGVDLGDRLAREDYFRHRVLEHLADRVNVGEGKQLRTPIGRGFLKGRTINPLDYSTNYLESEFEVIAQMRADTAKAKTLAWIADEKNGLNIKSRVQAEAKRINQEMKAAGDEGSPVIWEDLVPEGYGLWQPREGNVFYLAKSIPESIANKLIEGGMKEIGLTAKDVRKVLAMGGKRNQLVLPDEVIATLDNLGRKETDPYLQASAKLLNYWKQWQLISPGRVVKYNLRNVSGDLDAVIAGNPSALRQMRQTIDDLGNFYVKGEISVDLKGYLERGGIQTLLQAQEMGNVTALADLRKFAATEKSMAAKVAGAPVEAIKGIAQKLRSATDFREAILRYATYLDYLRQMRVGSGKPKNYGASIPEEVRALADPKDRAFKLQNDLIGAYNEISVLGQHVRRHWYPFWSFPEINIRRYTQLFKNASREGKLPEQVGRSLLGKIPATAYTAYQVGKFAMKASALWAIVTAQNMLFFPEEEEELPDDVKGRLHIVLGRTKDGQVRYFSRLGAVGDLLEWVGLDAPQQLVQDYLNGRKTVKEIGSEMALSPVNKVVSGLSPFPKMPIELLTGRSLFPDVSRPRTIRDRGLYAAQQFAVDGIYRELTGLPARPYLSSLGRTVVYYSDPGEAAYYGILDLKASYLRKINKGGEGTFTSPRTEAIRNVKLAIRYNDKEAVEKYVAEYVALGGKRSGIVESIERMEPLYGLNRRQQRDFRGKLSVADNEKLEKATRFWKDVLKKGKVGIRSALAKPEETPGWETVSGGPAEPNP